MVRSELITMGDDWAKAAEDQETKDRDLVDKVVDKVRYSEANVCRMFIVVGIPSVSSLGLGRMLGITFYLPHTPG